MTIRSLLLRMMIALIAVTLCGGKQQLVSGVPLQNQAAVAN
jgi:hypothetical protein